MRLAALYSIYNEEDFIRQSIASIYDAVERVVVCHTTGKPWFGPEQRADSTRRIISEFPDPADKITYVAASWPTEQVQRDHGLRVAREAGCDWGLIIDGDEVYAREQIDAIKRFAEQHPELRQFRISWNTYWKSPLWRIDPPEPFCPTILTRIGPDTRFTGLRRSSEEPIGMIPRDVAFLYHFSYAKPSHKIRAKISNFSHAGQILPGWWESVWLGWDADRDMENLHPTSPPCYKRAVYEGPEHLPAIMRSHPYVVEGVNGLGPRPKAPAVTRSRPGINAYRPEVRGDLEINRLVDDRMVYDPVGESMFLLNRSAAAVLDLCNGERSVAQIVVEVARAAQASAADIGDEVEDAIRTFMASGLFSVHARPARRNDGRPETPDAGNSERRGVSLTVPGLAPLRVPQLGDIGVGPPDTITAVQVLGPYNSGTCLMFNYPHHLTAAQTRHHLLCSKHTLPPVYAWGEGCRWSAADGGPPEALRRATLIVCMVRHPYFWLLSTARQNYDIRFEANAVTFSERLRCAVHFGGRRYDNLTAVWNAYYRAYRTHLEPSGAAFVRLEDLVEAPMAIVHALGRHLEILPLPSLEAEVARIAATPAKAHQEPCVAGEQARRMYRVDNVPALISAEDLALINEQIDHDLLAAFGYPIVHPPKA